MSNNNNKKANEIDKNECELKNNRENFYSINREFRTEMDISNYFSTIYWSHDFKIKKFANDLNKNCSTLTSAYISKSLLKKLNIHFDNNISKVIVSISLIDSPFTMAKSKDIVKRVINAIENSYQINYLTKSNDKKAFFALLNVLNDDEDGDDSIELSENLIRQYEISRYSRVQLKTVSQQEYLATKSRKIVIRTANENVSPL